MNNQGVHQTPKPKRRFFYGYIVVLISLCIMITTCGSRSSFGVFFKPILSEFGWSRALTSGAFSISTIMQGIFGIVMGNLNDRLGPRMVLTLCGFLLGLGYLLMSQISAVWQMYLFYVVIIGIGSGGAFVPLVSTVARWFVKRRSVMTGVVLAGLSAGLIVPIAINWFITIYGWRTSYLIMGAIVLIIIVLAAQLLRRDPIQKGQVPYGENQKGVEKSNSGIEGFSLKEAIYTRQFWLSFAMFFCLGFGLITVAVHIAPHATDLGFSAADAANTLAIMGGAGLFSGVILGSAADRIGNRQVFAICFVLMSAALFWLVSARELWGLYIAVALLNLGANGGGTLQSPLTAELFGIRSHGLIFGVANIGFIVGASAGPFMAGYIFDTTGSYQLAFQVCAVVGVIGLIIALTLRPIKKSGGRIQRSQSKSVKSKQPPKSAEI